MRCTVTADANQRPVGVVDRVIARPGDAAAARLLQHSAACVISTTT